MFRSSCCYCLSKQDVLSFSSSQQPGPPTQTVYLRLGQDLCDYTSYNQLPSSDDSFWQPHWAPSRGSHWVFFFLISICFNGFGLLFWEPACLTLTKGGLGSRVSGFSQKHLPRVLNVLCAALVCISPVFYDIAVGVGEVGEVGFTDRSQAGTCVQTLTGE